MTAPSLRLALSPRSPSPDNHVSAGSRPKRWIDVALALIVLILAAPLFALIAVVIATTSPGSVLFRQERVGLGGRRFTMLKFRTMRTNADESVHREYVLSMVRTAATVPNRVGAFKLAGDNRVTAIGALLRKSSIDELPQFLNVLIGDMSVVGPRPPLPYEVEHYDDWQLERLSARPGITGLWQVSGRNELPFAARLQFDEFYVRNWSLWLDLTLLLRTPAALLRGGAY